MSDAPQGEGWWQASDGKWYAPEQRTQQQPPPGAPAGYGPSPGPAGAGPRAGGPRSAGDVDAKGFFKALYDFQFDYFVTPKLIRFFYGLFVVLLSIGAVIVLIGSFASGKAGSIVAGIIVIPIFYLVYLIFLRIYMELIAALFRIADDLRAIRRDKGI